MFSYPKLPTKVQLYEIVFILRQDLQTQEVHRISDQYKEDVKAMGAEIKKFEYWGFRSLCHAIKKIKKVITCSM